MGCRDGWQRKSKLKDAIEFGNETQGRKSNIAFCENVTVAIQMGWTK